MYSSPASPSTVNYRNGGFDMKAEGKTVKAGGMLTNPVIRRLEQTAGWEQEGQAATYSGIMVKTLFFLLMTLAGAALYMAVGVLDPVAISLDGGLASITALQAGLLLLSLLLTLVMPFIAGFAPRTIPVTGTVYSLAQGYAIACVSVLYAAEYREIVWLALGLTLLIILVMLLVYRSGMIRVTHRFTTVLRTVLFTLIIASILVGLCAFFPGTRVVYDHVINNPALSIGGGVLFIVLAALFLLSDFECIRRTVERRLPKQAEWIAAYGLAFTVIWLYLKVLSLLARVKRD